MEAFSCTPVIKYGIYAQASYKKWEGRKVTFEGYINLSSHCLIKELYQSKYPGSLNIGFICAIREDSQGAAEFWLCFRKEKDLWYHYWVPAGHIDWDNYFNLK